MDAREPRVRRRGFFLHSSEAANRTPANTKTPKDSSFASASPRHSGPSPGSPARAAAVRRPTHRTDRPTKRPADQIRERDWQPSTGTLAPLIQLARGDTRNATTAPTSSGRPNRPNGSSRRTNSAIPAGILLLTRVPRSARKQNRPRRHAVDADVVARQLLRHRLGQADFGRLHGVVGHPAARFAAPDRRDHHDRAAAAPPHVRHGQPRRADRRKQRLVERLLPLGVGGVDDVGAPGEADVVDEDVEAAEGLDRSRRRRRATPLSVARVGLTPPARARSPPGSVRSSAAAVGEPRLRRARRSSPGSLPATSAVALAKPKPAARAGDDRDFVGRGPRSMRLDAVSVRRGRSGRSASSRTGCRRPGSVLRRGIPSRS